jgi:hypothetical protein
LKIERRILCGILTVALWSVPSSAFADTGLPMIVLAFPGMAVLFIPIVAIEAYVLRRILGSSYSRALGPVVVGNAVSTFFGIPVAWILMVIAQFTFLNRFDVGWQASGPGLVRNIVSQSAFLPPYPGIQANMSWALPLAMLVLLVPFFLASWLIEYWVARLMMRDVEPRLVLRGVLVANAASYVMLAVVLGALALAGI